MATVFFPSLVRQQTGGLAKIEVPGATVGELMIAIEARFPGISQHLLRPNLAISVDDEVTPLGVLEPVRPDSEVHFIAAISGG
jgi:molybdopterin converting factor small subunit